MTPDTERLPPPPEPVAESLRDVSDGLSRLVKDHVELARAELVTGARRIAFDAALTGTGAGLLAVSWLLLMFAAGYGLGTIIGNGLAFLIIGGVHGLIGFALVGVFGQRLRSKDKPDIHNTQEEIAEDRHFLHRVGEIMRPPRAPA